MQEPRSFTDVEPLEGVVVNRPSNPLKGHVAQKLMRDLALSGRSQKELAAEYGVTQVAVSKFSKRHEQEIERIQTDSADEYAGLWISNKLNRLAELQSLAEDLLTTEITAKTAGEVRNILRAVAEELGDIPNKPGVAVNVSNTRYEIANVDLDDLT